MDFSRGIWSAAMNGEVDRVKKLLSEGTSVNIQDTSGYSALVCTITSNYHNINMKLALCLSSWS